MAGTIPAKGYLWLTASISLQPDLLNRTAVRESGNPEPQDRALCP